MSIVTAHDCFIVQLYVFLFMNKEQPLIPLFFVTEPKVYHIIIIKFLGNLTVSFCLPNTVLCFIPCSFIPYYFRIKGLSKRILSFPLDIPKIVFILCAAFLVHIFNAFKNNMFQSF